MAFHFHHLLVHIFIVILPAQMVHKVEAINSVIYYNISRVQPEDHCALFLNI